MVMICALPSALLVVCLFLYTKSRLLEVLELMLSVVLMLSLVPDAASVAPDAAGVAPDAASVLKLSSCADAVQLC